MTPRALIGHALFLAIALGFAWSQANREETKEGGPTSVTLLDAKKGEVSKVVYTWPKGTSTIESKGKDAARVAVMSVSREVEKNKPDAGPETTKEEAKFPAGHGVIASLEAFEPMKSKRTLGEVPSERLKAMGLDKPERSVVVTAGGKTVELELGESAYGGQGRYARVKGQTAVHLLDSAVSTGFEGGADSLMEKRVVVANVEEITGYGARYGDKDGSYVQWDREQASKRRFTPKDDPSSTNEAPGKLMTTLRNLRATKLADPKIAASAVATFVVETTGRDKQKVDVLERTDGEGHVIATDGWLFEINETQGKELLDDLQALWQ
jgi:hypothetical protein